MLVHETCKLAVEKYARKLKLKHMRTIGRQLLDAKNADTSFLCITSFFPIRLRHYE